LQSVQHAGVEPTFDRSLHPIGLHDDPGTARYPAAAARIAGSHGGSAAMTDASVQGNGMCRILNNAPLHPPIAKAMTLV
jgi:hypothetical protein